MNKKDMLIKEKLQQDKKISDKANIIFENVKEEFNVENNGKKVIQISFNQFVAIAVSLVIVGFLGISLYANALGKPNIISGIQALIQHKENVDETAKALFEEAVLAIRDTDRYCEFEEDVKEVNGIYYKKTSLSFEELKEKYAEIFTGEALENVLNLIFCNIDDIAYGIPTAGPGYVIEDVAVEKINEDDNEITYRASYKKSYTDNPEGMIYEDETCEFKIKKVDEQYKISATNYMELDKKQDININDNEGKVYKQVTTTTLNEKDVLFITEAIYNGNNSYTLNGVIYRHDDYNHNEAQIEDRWILTDEYYTITVSKDLPCNKYFDFEGKFQTVDDVFSNYEKVEPMNTANPNYEYSFRFIFKNDKCIEIKNVLTSLGDGESDFSDSDVIQENENSNNANSETANNNTQGNNNNSNSGTANNNGTQQKSYLIGDANCDGVVNIADAHAVNQYLNNGRVLSNQGVINSDVNDDDEVTSADYEILMKYVNGSIDRLPYRTSNLEMASKNVPGYTIKYPSNWSVTEINKSRWGSQPGEPSCTFIGIVNGVNLIITTYEPKYIIGGYENLFKNECAKYGINYGDWMLGVGYNIGSTDEEHLEWQKLFISSECSYYYHIIDEVNCVLMIRVEKKIPLDVNNLPAERVLDDIFFNITIGSY